jgi:outer membrane protein assembly factor BamB
VYALNAASGSQIWSFGTGGSVFPSPAVVDGVVYVGSATGYMYALSAVDGSPLWSYCTGGAIFSSPAVVDGVVYFGSQDQNLYALNASDGSQVWSFATGGFIDTSPVVANGVVYFGSRDGYVYAVNAANGVQLWSFRALHGNYGSYYYSTPAVANGVLYVGSYDSYIYALNATDGSVFWEFRTGGYIFSSPVVAGSVVYVGSFDGAFYALNASKGGKIWSHQTGNQIRSSPAIVNGVAYIGSGDGYLYAFYSPNAQPATSYEISGYILDEDGNGINGAHIIFNVPDIVPSVTSTPSGYYAISAPAGTYHVNVWPPFDSNYINYDETGFTVESNMTKNITLQSGYKVSGYITNSSGNPVVGAAVLLDNYGSGWFSNASGYYFLNVPAGTYTLTARPRTGNYYSGPTTDFPTYHEYNFTVNGDTIKNITVGSTPQTSSPNHEPLPSTESSPEQPSASPPELGSSPEQPSTTLDTATPGNPTTPTNAANVSLLGIILGILIVATPIASFITGCLLFYFKKRGR